MSRRRRVQTACACGSTAIRPGQRNCKACHAADMRARRAAAKAAGTYTLRVPRATPRGVDTPVTAEQGLR